MEEAPTSPYIEVRDGGYYVAGTRIGLDVIVHEFQAGKSPEAILQSHSPIGSLAKVYGVITFILEHPERIRSLPQRSGAALGRTEGEAPPSRTCYSASSALVSSFGILREGSLSG